MTSDELQEYQENFVDLSHSFRDIDSDKIEYLQKYKQNN
jgi:hypothetical protein